MCANMLQSWIFEKSALNYRRCCFVLFIRSALTKPHCNLVPHNWHNCHAIRPLAITTTTALQLVHGKLLVDDILQFNRIPECTRFTRALYGILFHLKKSSTRNFPFALFERAVTYSDEEKVYGKVKFTPCFFLSCDRGPREQLLFVDVDCWHAHSLRALIDGNDMLG